MSLTEEVLGFMADRNSVAISGRITETRAIPLKDGSGSGVRLTVEVARNGENARGDKFSVISWPPVADALKELSVGERVYVSGRLQRQSWIDKQNQRRWDTEILALEAKADYAPSGEPF